MWKWPGPEVRVRASTFGLGTLALFVVVAVLFGDPNRKVAALLSEWQTLIAGLLAIVAAWVSLSGPREQIRQADRLAAEAAAREEFAARAMLPIGLNYITEYAAACMTLTEHEWKTTKRQGNPIKLPSFDRSNLTLIRDCIRHSPQPYRDRMVALLAAVQILEANSSEKTKIFPEHSLLVMCIDVVYLCETLFDYARGNPDSYPTDTPLRAPTYRIRGIVAFRPTPDGFWPMLEGDLKRRDENDAARKAAGDTPTSLTAQPPA